MGSFSLCLFHSCEDCDEDEAYEKAKEYGREEPHVPPTYAAIKEHAVVIQVDYADSALIAMFNFAAICDSGIVSFDPVRRLAPLTDLLDIRNFLCLLLIQKKCLLAFRITVFATRYW